MKQLAPLIFLVVPTLTAAQVRIGAEIGAPFVSGARAEVTVSRLRVGALFLGYPKLAIRHFVGGQLAVDVLSTHDGYVYLGGAFGRGSCTSTGTDSCDFKRERAVASVAGGVEMPLASNKYTLGVEFANWFDLGDNARDFSRRSMSLIFRYRLY